MARIKVGMFNALKMKMFGKDLSKAAPKNLGKKVEELSLGRLERQKIMGKPYGALDEKNIPKAITTNNKPESYMDRIRQRHQDRLRKAYG
jgi:hypothetical protein